jgi:hypothetical protein
MLYVNVYLVSQLYGGPEEGNWYFDAGQPLGSIPIKTKQETKDYYITSETNGHGRNATVDKVTIHLRECSECKGTGKVEKESEERDANDEAYVYEAKCDFCGEVPEDLEATAKLMKEMYDMFEGEPGRYEHIQVMLQKQFATPFPDRKPHYE